MVATATKKRKKQSSGRGGSNGNGHGQPVAQPKMSLPVQFGDVSIGQGVAAIGVTIQRQSLSIGDADEKLCCKRLNGRIIICPGQDDETQTYINEAKVKHRVNGAFDVRGFRVTPKTFTTRLSFSIESINVEELSHFAKQSGRLIAELILGIPKEAKHDPKQKSLPLDGPWADQEISLLNIGDNTAGKLYKNGVNNLGQLKTLIKSANDALEKIVGKRDAQHVDQALVEFFASHPEIEHEDEEEPAEATA